MDMVCLASSIVSIKEGIDTIVSSRIFATVLRPSTSSTNSCMERSKVVAWFISPIEQEIRSPTFDIVKDSSLGQETSIVENEIFATSYALVQEASIVQEVDSPPTCTINASHGRFDEGTTLHESTLMEAIVVSFIVVACPQTIFQEIAEIESPVGFEEDLFQTTART